MEPPGVDALLGSYFDTEGYEMVTVVEARETWATVRVAPSLGVSKPVTQHPCAPTTELEVVIDNPSFRVPPFDTTQEMDGVAIQLYDVGAHGTFRNPGTLDITAAMVLDVASLAPAIGAEGGAEVCDLAASLGVVCERCPDGRNECIAVEAVQEGVATGGVAVENNDASDCEEPVGLCGECSAVGLTAVPPFALLAGLMGLRRRRR